MADTSATIIAASLSSEELEKSIDKLVGNVATATNLIRKDFDDMVSHIKQSLNSLGDIKINSSGSSDGGSSRRSKLLSQEGEVLQQNNQIAKEYNTTLDQQAALIRKVNQVSVRVGDASSVRNADTLQTMNTQLDLLRERLRDARNQYSSFVALASHATTTGDKGLYQFATDGVHKYEQEVKNLIPQIRNMQLAIAQMGDVIAPQGHTIQNYVNSLQKTNPELAQLNEQFKKGQSELQNQSASYNSATQSAQNYTEEIRKQAQAIRESAQWREKGYATISGVTIYNLEKETTAIKSRIPLEEQLLQLNKSAESSIMQQAVNEKGVADAARLTGEELKKIYSDQKAVNEEINKRASGVRNGGTTPFQSYDNLRQSIASVLGIQEQQVRLANTEKDSYNQLSSTLKKLKQAYDTLGKSDRNSDQGKALVASIHEVERAMQNIKAQSSRPINLQSVTGLSEKTLDDIAYKMRQLAAYRSGLDVNTRRAEIREVNTEYDRLKKKMDEVMQKNSQMVASNNALGRSWNYMKNRLAFYFTVGASTQFIKNLIEVRSQYEMNERALGILINSAERGTQIFNELSQMALVSPYTLIELSNAAKQLTAYDIAAKDVVDTTRRLADMAAAVGVPMERLTYALGQIKAYGYLNSRDARMFANAGIPLVRELSKYYTELEGKMVSVGDVYDRMKKKAIDFNSVMSVVTKMTDEGGKFFDFQAKMADTLKVRLANLTLAWNNMLNEMGAETQGVLTTAIGGLKTLFAHWRDIDKMLKTFAWTFGMAKLAQIIQIANIGLAAFGKQMAWNIILGRKLSSVVFTLARSLKTLALSPVTWITLLATALTSATIAIWNMNEAQESLNKTLRESAKDNYNNIKQFLENYDSIRNSLYKEKKDEETGKITITPIDIDKGEAKKAWEAIREQIELSSHASDEYIGSLLKIENVSERVRKGFEVLDEIQTVSAALKELGDDAIKTNTDWSDWWNANLLPDGWVENLRDYEKELDNVRGKYDDVSSARAKWERNKYKDSTLNEDFVSLNTALVRLQNNIATTALSVKEFLESKEWDKDVNKINEVFKQVGDKMVQEGQLNPKDAFVFQTQWEDARSQVAKRALETRIADEKNALAVARDENRKADINSRIETLQEELKEFNLYNGKSKAYWDNFTKWLKEQHRSEMTEMFRGMDAEQIKSINFQEGQYGAWISRMVSKYKKENKLSNDEVFQYLHHWVTNANKWSIFIPLTISTESDKTIYQQLTEADSAIDTAYKKIERLKTRRDELAEKGGALSKDKKVAQEYTMVLEEIKSAQQDYNKALEQGGHSKKENAAASKAQKQAESELQKALKDELQLIDKVRSQYKKLTDAGATDGEALAMVTNQFANSLAHVNKVLGKNGIPLFDISKFAGTDNPRALLDMLKLQLDSAKIAKNIKPEEIKELEVKYSEIVVDAKSYDLTKITKGLNNELDRLKDEYELAVSLDADPELGDMFADMFGIDTNTLPQTFGEALDRAQEIINRKLADLNIASPFDIMQTDVNEFANSSGLEKESEAIKELAKWQNTFRDMFKKNILDSEKMLDDYVKKYGSYSDKIAEIEADRLEKIKKLNDAYYTEEMRQRPEYIAKMNAINQGASREKSNVEFDAFKNSRYYTMMFENLDYVSTKTIRDMRDRLRELMDSMKDLTPEQLKQVMTQYEKLEQKLVKRSPFKTLTKDLKNYLKTSGDRKAANEAFRNAQKEYDAQEKSVAALKEKYEQAKANNNTSQSYLDFLKIEIDGENEILQILKEQLEIAEQKADKYNLIKKLALEELSQTATMVAANLKGLAELRDQMNELFGVDASKGETLLGHKIDGLIDGLSKASDGISKITSSAQSGNVFGIASGAVDVITGIGDGIASLFGDGSARTKRLNREINESRETVRQLSMAYDDLERAINKSLGTGETEARRLAIANKEAQLAELERQKELEQSKRSKDRDDDAIKQYEETMHSLRNEINDLKEDVINNLWGEEVKSAAEAFVDAWVQAWRAGETTLDAIQEKMDEMIYNLIKKAMTSKIVETLLNPVYKELDRMTKEGSEGGVALTINELRQLAQQAGITAGEINTALGEFYGNLEQLGIVSKTEDGSNELSALQQGISQISETTANALEAYMNSVNQQVYLHSDLLTQIRNVMVGWNFDVQLGVLSQMLLQLQNNYIVMQSMQSMMEGWTTPSGQGIRVELIS